MEFIKTQKGREMLVLDGFSFVRERKGVNGKLIWKCSQYSDSRCLARCHTIDGVLVKNIGHHNHVPDAAKIAARKTVEDIKLRAATTQEAGHQIVASTAAVVTAAVAAQLPSVNGLKQTIRRERREKEIPLPNPENLQDLIIPDAYKTTTSGENFLSYDSGPGQNRFLIFATQRNLDRMVQCENWYADGTFKSSPPLFQQIYTIHALRYSDVIPTVFILMSDRSTTSYVRVFTELKRLQPALDPKTVMTDFEQAAILAWTTVFPNATQRGCFFHLSQCLWRHLQQTPGLQQRYTTDAEFALAIRQLAALAFVPPNDVSSAFDDLMETHFYQIHSTILRPLVNYFEDTWIGRPGRRGRGRNAPMFSHALWNCYDASLDDLPKTNNSVEGWHRGFSQLLGAHHPSIWKFIKGIKKEESMNEMKLEQYVAGQQPPPGKRVYKDTAERIKTIVADYGLRPTTDYLRGIAHNLRLQI